ncbi:lipid IV(A) 3-deoxy-D-manno-octulosonic acid transferase [Shewanella donghaensis]|uniref:lipid IV(A) 3-deoxy-D-manno-octulosonic acid transferase n=1 Tax=Shewanella donghaensis TaxID=238836 RepID=UPI0011845EC8|nr:lipid IV(A) 3-deoxy-D-manno-octulosonic acid transferase [Shewanella donghaensis]
MTRGIYSVLLLLLFPLILAYLGFRTIKSPDYRGRWGERFGLTRLKQTDVLFHSVSMGETLAAIPVIKTLMSRHPQLTFTVTTTSPTGSAEVIKAFGDSVQHCYLPFDINFCVSRFIKQVNPKLCVIMETELWPNLLYFAKKNNTRLVLANARLSQKSADKYQKQITLSRPMLVALDAIAVQTQAESNRFEALGVMPDVLSVCGSLKFDLQIDDNKYSQAKTLKDSWDRSQAPVWVAGSVHPGEFDIMLQAHKEVLQQYPDALLIMAPRHPEQFNVAAVSVTQQGLTLARRSMNEAVNEQTQVILGDTMGELLMLYGTANFAFVGGTLIENGGHNPLEPAAMGLPVCVGPHHWDFAEITTLLEQAGGLRVIQDSDELAELLLQMFSQADLHDAAAKASLEVVAQNRGAMQKQLEIIEQQLQLSQLIQ